MNHDLSVLFVDFQGRQQVLLQWATAAVKLVPVTVIHKDLTDAPQHIQLDAQQGCSSLILGMALSLSHSPRTKTFEYPLSSQCSSQ